ncbi:MAG: histidine phosphatase family protein [Dehalococcoidia bacterium]|nr:MAG: histidine phosphatase family protein [Dehalococcoidia bacterium]
MVLGEYRLRLILVRHGETDTDNPGKCHGATDIDLSAEGYRQAKTLRQRFAGEHLDAIYSSTLIRGIRTAEAIASEHDIEIIRCPEVNEVDFGLIECITFEEACELYPEVTELWRQNSTELCFPEGEKFVDFQKRSVQFLERLKNHKDDETVMLVGHGGPFRLMLCHLLDLPMRHYWQFIFARASVSIVNIYSHGAILERLNDVSHLQKNRGLE